MVEQGTENPRVVGSIPTGGILHADLAHLVERHLAKVEVAGSSPVIRFIAVWKYPYREKNPERQRSGFFVYTVFSERRCGMHYFLEMFRNSTVLLGYGILLYTFIMVLLRQKAEVKGHKVLYRIALFLPLAAVLVHCCFFWLPGHRFVHKIVPDGDSFRAVRWPLNLKLYPHLYAAALLPLILLLPLRKKLLRVLISCVLCIALGYCALFQQFDLFMYSKLHNYTRLSWSEGFRRTVADMRKEYVLGDWKQIDYDLLLETYLPQVRAAEQANDPAAFGALLSDFTYRFYDQHVTVNMNGDDSRGTKDLLAGNDYGLTLFTLTDGETIAVLVSEDGDAYANGIRNGTVITAWDGVPVREAAASVACIYPNYRMQFAVRENEDIYRPLFLSGKGGDTVRVTYLDEDGAEQTVSLSSSGSARLRLSMAITDLKHDWLDTENFGTKMISDTCGYLRIIDEEYQKIPDYIAYLRKGYYPRLTNDINQKLEQLKAQGMETLVIDLRNNNGGLHVIGGAVCSLFTEEKRFLMYGGQRSGNTFRGIIRYDFFPDGRWKDLPVVVLVNQATMSAGDSTALFLGQNENVTLMGITASSGVTQSIGGICYLSGSFSVRYPVYPILGEDNLPMIDTDASRENRIPLDHVIPVDKDAALRIFDRESDGDDDYELEYAIQYLQSGLQ